jgi:hypothetical protein
MDAEVMKLMSTVAAIMLKSHGRGDNETYVHSGGYNVKGVTGCVLIYVIVTDFRDDDAIGR